MKIKLLKKLRRDTKIYYSREKKVKDSETQESIKGRFCVYNPATTTWYYHETKAGAIKKRREIILEKLERIRHKNGYTRRPINI